MLWVVSQKRGCHFELTLTSTEVVKWVSQVKKIPPKWRHLQRMACASNYALVILLFALFTETFKRCFMLNCTALKLKYNGLVVCHRRTQLSLIHVKVCHLFDTKPLPELIRTLCQYNSIEINFFIHEYHFENGISSILISSRTQRVHMGSEDKEGFELCKYPDSKVHGANMGPTWALSAPDGSHVGLMNFAIRV